MSSDEVILFLQSDVSLSGFKKHKVSESAPPPLTDQELELEMVKQQEVRDLTLLFRLVLQTVTVTLPLPFIQTQFWT